MHAPCYLSNLSLRQPIRAFPEIIQLLIQKVGSYHEPGGWLAVWCISNPCGGSVWASFYLWRGVLPGLLLADDLLLHRLEFCGKGVHCIA